MPVLPPCGTRLVPAFAQARTKAATSCVEPGLATASALPRMRLRQSCSQAVRSPSVNTCCAPTMARRLSGRVVMAGLQAEPHVQGAGGEKDEGKCDLEHRELRRKAAFAPRPNHAFGEIEPHQQAQPP